MNAAAATGSFTFKPKDANVIGILRFIVLQYGIPALFMYTVSTIVERRHRRQERGRERELSSTSTTPLSLPSGKIDTPERVPSLGPDEREREKAPLAADPTDGRLENSCDLVVVARRSF